MTRGQFTIEVVETVVIQLVPVAVLVQCLPLALCPLALSNARAEIDVEVVGDAEEAVGVVGEAEEVVDGKVSESCQSHLGR